MSTLISASQSESVKQYYDIVEKSMSDKRDYKGLLLNNDMKVLLISDPTTDKSAAAIRVNVGSMSDPVEFLGLAHFLEHILFLGTEKYPGSDDYDKYLALYGGSANALTENDHTIYQFDILPDQLEGALDRFAQFFIQPLFTESIVNLEVNAVDSEYQGRFKSDSSKIQQLVLSSGDPSHPFTKFNSGNRESLDSEGKDMNVRDALIKFYNTWYSSNIMSLSVLGKESLEELEKMVVKIFTKIANKNVESPTWPEHPYKPEHFKTKWFAVPSEVIQSLTILFPTQSVEERSKFNLAYYIVDLLGHEGDGSLLSVLKKKAWGNTTMADAINGARGACKFLSLSVELTEEGFDHVDDIITLVFQYINMLKKEGVVEWIFQEMKQLQKIAYDYKEKKLPIDYVQSKVSDLMEYPMEQVLIGPNIYTEWDPEFLRNYVLDQLTPENIRVYVVSHKYKGTTTEIEPWYETEFRKEKIPEEMIKIWQNCGFSTDLTLPTKNEFIPQDFTIKADGNSVIDQFPTVIKKSSLMQLWFKQDNEFLLPKVNLSLQILSPVSSSSADNANLLQIYTNLIMDSIGRYAYNAKLADLNWALNSTVYGITLVISGYHDTYAKLLEKIIDIMVHSTVDEKRFEIVKDNYFRDLENFQTQKPLQLAEYYRNVLVEERVWEIEDLLNASKNTTVEALNNFISQLLDKFYLELVLHGNLTKEEALETGQMIESKFKELPKSIKPLLSKERVRNRQIDMKAGFTSVYTAENHHNPASATDIYYQCGLQSTESNVNLKLLKQIISDSFFNDLRTEQQLGYKVDIEIFEKNCAQGLIAVIQGNEHPTFVDSRIEIFMKKMSIEVADMKEEIFEDHKAVVAAKLNEKPSHMKALTTDFLREINCQHYNFDHNKLELEYLKTVTHDHIVAFFKNLVDPETKSKLAVHVVSKVYDPFTIVITDINEFKASQGLYPLSIPLITLPEKIV